MGQLRFPDPMLLVVAAFSRHSAALDWAAARLRGAYGPVVLKSPDFDFHQTHYYESSMGPNLKKQFLVFADLVPFPQLPSIKRATNDLELALALAGDYSESRPLNLDPGLLCLGKFYLATTKDQSHRIYLNDGIFAEVTLRFQDGCFGPWPWTYADYREEGVITFLNEAREIYRRQLKESCLAAEERENVGNKPPTPATK